MSEFDIQEYADYDTFVEAWHAEENPISATETRMLWQLLGQLDAEELLIQLPEWLAEQKVGFVEGATPTLFVGRIARETEKAIRVTDSAAARPLMKPAHQITHFEEGIDDADEDRRPWLQRRLQETRDEFAKRDDVPSLREEWLPKSQVVRAVRRRR